jgi:uncharacterized protein
MQGIYLRFFVHAFQKHKGHLLYEWLLEAAKKEKLPGGHATRALAGFGRHHVMLSERFFELGSDVPVEVAFAVTREEGERLIALLKKEKLNLFYVLSEVEWGFS